MIFAGIWMLLILVAFSKLVAEVAMPTLAAVLIYAGVGSLKPAQVLTILRTGPTPMIALTATFVATLLLPVAVAVGIGVTISLLLQLNQESMDLRVVRLRLDDDGQFVEEPVPEALSDHDVVILDVYGSLFYAGARTLQLKLPDPAQSEGSVVILRLRGRTTLGATFFIVVSGYARELGEPKRAAVPLRARRRDRRSVDPGRLRRTRRQGPALPGLTADRGVDQAGVPGCADARRGARGRDGLARSAAAVLVAGPACG